MRRRLIVLLLALMPAMGAIVAPRPAGAWVRGGLGIVYGGPYAVVQPYPPAVYVPPAYYPPAYYAAPVAPCWPPPGYVVPPVVAWPSYGPDVAVRWNRYFTPDGPSIQGYTLPR